MRQQQAAFGHGMMGMRSRGEIAEEVRITLGGFLRQRNPAQPPISAKELRDALGLSHAGTIQLLCALLSKITPLGLGVTPASRHRWPNDPSQIVDHVRAVIGGLYDISAAEKLSGDQLTLADIAALTGLSLDLLRAAIPDGDLDVFVATHTAKHETGKPTAPGRTELAATLHTALANAAVVRTRAAKWGVLNGSVREIARKALPNAEPGEPRAILDLLMQQGWVIICAPSKPSQAQSRSPLACRETHIRLGEYRSEIDYTVA